MLNHAKWFTRWGRYGVFLIIGLTVLFISAVSLLSGGASGGQNKVEIQSHAFLQEFLGFDVYDPAAVLPDLVFYDADGQTVRLSDFRGQYVILNFWATWCAPCIEELPSIARLYKKYGQGDSAQNIAIVPIAFDFNPDTEKLKGFLARHEAAGLPLYVDSKGLVQRVVPTKGLPTTLILNPKGDVFLRVEGAADWMGAAGEDFIHLLLSDRLNP